MEAALRMKNPGGLILHEAVSSPRAPNANKSSDDWVELYNGGGQSVDLSGYGLSDDPGRPRKWRFPQGASIAPGQYLVVLLNGADKHDVPTGRYAASFRLNHVHGETLILSASDGTLIDRLPMLDQAAAVSFGRVDGSGYYYLETMTPGATNIGEGRRGKLDPVTFSRSGGPVDQAFTLSLTAPEEVAIHYTLDASEPILKSPYTAAPWPSTRPPWCEPRPSGTAMFPPSLPPPATSSACPTPCPWCPSSRIPAICTTRPSAFTAWGKRSSSTPTRAPTSSKTGSGPPMWNTSAWTARRS